MRLILPLDNWPADDQRMWHTLFQGGGPLDDRGPLAHFKEASRRILRTSYGHWLAWLTACNPAALSDPPTLRVTADRLVMWAASMNTQRPMTRYSRVSKVIGMIVASAAGRDCSDLLRVSAHFRRLAGRGDITRKSGRILPTSELLEAGIVHARAPGRRYESKLSKMRRHRNGTMLAMLALVPMRLRAFANLRIGESILIDGPHMVIDLSREMTKTESFWDAEVPDIIAPLLREYITTVRPWLMAKASVQHDQLWVLDNGDPMDGPQMSRIMANVTERLLGKRIRPHLFRDAAATTLSREAPEAARLIAPVLGHSNPQTAERHYIRADSIHAGRQYADVVQRLKRKLR